MTPVNRLASSGLSIVLVAVVALAAHVDPWFVAAAVVVVQSLVAAAPRLRNARGRTVQSPRFVPAFAAGLVATALVMVPGVLDGAQGTGDALAAANTGTFAGVLVGVVVGVFTAAVTQMLRRDGRKELTASLAYAVTLAVAAALAVGWIGAAQSFGGADAVTVAAAGLAGGVLVWALPGDRFVVGGASVVAGALAAGGACLVLGAGPDPVLGVAIGGATAVFAVMGQVLGRALIGGRAHVATGWGFPGATSVALAAPIAYVGSQLVATRLF